MLISASFILVLIASGSIAFGLRYLFAQEYMSYHAELTGLTWTEIPARYQAVILGMLKMVGAGMLAFGVAVIWFVFPLYLGERWPIWAIFSVVSVHGLISVYVTLILRRVNPSAKTNVASAFGGVVLSFGALALAYAAQA
ncbi:hypothetical protein [Duganella sp. Root1480D1]|uniref:hypothetical protein n=1 Tax=Duganella sp. Root1480D1 TaxID=1736471 RepID=UPI0007091201|nr:hypothetical protein [Duganella sp. Root1480D1]KQZ45031.1 hypothetical protein ASD58_01910 [Duganella sp. Root1480D1]